MTGNHLRGVASYKSFPFLHLVAYSVEDDAFGVVVAYHKDNQEEVVHFTVAARSLNIIGWNLEVDDP